MALSGSTGIKRVRTTWIREEAGLESEHWKGPGASGPVPYRVRKSARSWLLLLRPWPAGCLLAPPYSGMTWGADVAP